MRFDSRVDAIFQGNIMKSTINRTLFYLLIIAVIVSGIRFAWLESSSRYASSMWMHEWRGAILNTFGFETTEIGEQKPINQAKYWLKHVEKVDAVQTEAEIAIGAAWVLDSLSHIFEVYHQKDVDSYSKASWFPLSLKYNLKFESINEMVEDFEKVCDPACLSMIEKATELEEDNPEVWRNRALLLFKRGQNVSRMQPRVSNWMKVLESCKEHDPQNALYDYLIALQLWNQSASYEFEENFDDDDFYYLLTINDQPLFEQGNHHFQLGQRKELLSYGRIAYTSSGKFLEHTGLPTTQVLEKLRITKFYGRVLSIQSRLERWNAAFLEDAGRKEKYSKAIFFANLILRISDQFQEDENHADSLTWKKYCRSRGLDWLVILNEMDPNLEHSEDLEVLRQLRFDSIFENHLRSEIFKRIKRKKLSKSLIPVVILSRFGQVIMITSFLIGIVSCVVAFIFRRFHSKESSLRSLPWQVSAWFLGISLGLFSFGLCASGFISPGLQHPIFCVCIVAIGVLFSFFSLLLIQRWLKIPWLQLIAMAISTFVVIVGACHYSEFLTWIEQFFAGRSSTVLVVLLFTATLVAIGLIIHGVASFFSNSDFAMMQKVTRLLTVFTTIGAVYIGVSQAVSYLPLEFEIEKIVLENSYMPLSRTPLPGLQFDYVFSDFKETIVSPYLTWEYHMGAIWSGVFSVLLLAIFFFSIKIRNSKRYFDVFQRNRRVSLFEFSRLVTHSCVVIFLLFSVIHMTTHPMVLRQVEPFHWDRYERLVNDEVNRSEFEIARNSVFEDTTNIEKLKDDLRSLLESR